MRNTAPEYYLSYLFVRIYHTWLLGLFALGAIVLWYMRRKQATVGERLALGFVTWWSVGLLAVFSLLPVSINPLALISKQTNYMLMFVAPLSLLAGYTLAQFRGWLLVGILVTVLAPSLILIALQQSVVHKVTANSKAAVAFSLTHSDAILFAGTNATRAARFYNLTNPNAPPAKIEPLTNLLDAEHTDFYFNSSSVSRYAVIDAEKPLQNRELSVRNPENVPSCWAHIEILEPSGFGFGLHVVKSVQRIVAAIPDPIGSSLAQTIGAIVQPKPAQVFQIPNEGCSDAQDY